MANKTAPEANTEQKVQTRYDRKMEARKQQEAKDRKEERRFKIISTLVILALTVFIVGGIGFSVYSKQTALKAPYVKIGEKEVTRLEYDYYYNNVKNSYLNMYSSLLPYMGIDPAGDFESQPYTENLTWKDMFDQMTVQQLSQAYGLLADAEKAGFTYDVTEEYNTQLEALKTSAEAAGLSLSNYIEAMFGGYATEKNIESFMKQDILAAAYYNELMTLNAPSAEEIDAYYAENKDSYDKVDYRSFTFTVDMEALTPEAEESTKAQSDGTEAETDAAEGTAEAADTAKTEAAAAEPSEEDIAAAMDELEGKAEAFMAARQEGQDFEELCLEHASETDKVNYESEETEYSLKEGQYRSAVPSAASEWLYDDARKEGDITVIADETAHRYYVVEFVSKYYDEADDTNISNLIASERVTEYVNQLIEGYPVTDLKGELAYLTVEEAVPSEEASETETDTDAETATETDTETDTDTETVTDGGMEAE